MDKCQRPYAPGPQGPSVAAFIRWIPALMLVALLTATLVACGGGDGGSAEQPSRGGAGSGTTEPTAEPTQDAQMQEGGELRTEEYAAAMEEIAATQQEEGEAAFGAFFSNPPYSAEEAERFFALETSESWSQEDVAFASEVAETILQATTGLYGELLSIIRDSFDEMSRLAPPEHLSDLHDEYIATAREVLQLFQESVETVQGTDTNIGDRDELADFSEAVDSLESGPSAPELEERADAACIALTRQLESELERDVSICDAEESDATSAGPALEPAPTAAPAATPKPTAAATRALIPALDSTSAETDREALIALYNATDGPNWTNSDNWLSDEPLGEWYGVETDAGRVVALVLSENGLTGGLPAELGQLSDLEWLDLFRNQLSGNIPPELGRLSSLEGLALLDNDLSGGIPAELGQLSDLAWLDLRDNRLSGNIPPELGQLSYLDGLELSNNELSGEIPVELGHLSNLEHLSAYNNQLSGAIPAELGRLSKLDYLDLSNNHLSGEVPAELGRLSNLEVLHLDYNELSGEIPSELGQLSNLEELYLAGNNFTGCVPDALRDVDENDLDELGLPSC